MLAVLFLVRRGVDILIVMPRSILDATLSRLKMFVLRARLTIEKADDIDALAIFGNDAPAMMSRYTLPVPEVPLQCIDDPRGLRVMRRLGSVTRYSVIGPREQIEALRTAPDDTQRTDDGSHWPCADIVQGILVILP